MNKFMVMILTVFAFAIVGCGKSDKEKCEDQDGKQWNADEEKCEDKSADDDGNTVATYTVINKHATLTVDVTAGEATSSLAKDACVTVTEEQTSKLKISYTQAGGTETVVCDNSDSNVDNDCLKNNLEVVIKSDDPAAAQANTAAAAAPNCNNLVVATAPASYTVTNKGSTAVDLSSGTAVAVLAENECANVTASQVAQLSIKVQGATSALCDATTACPAKNLEINPDGTLKQENVVANASCAKNLEEPDPAAS